MLSVFDEMFIKETANPFMTIQLDNIVGCEMAFVQFMSPNGEFISMTSISTCKQKVVRAQL